MNLQKVAISKLLDLKPEHTSEVQGQCCAAKSSALFCSLQVDQAAEKKGKSTASSILEKMQSMMMLQHAWAGSHSSMPQQPVQENVRHGSGIPGSHFTQLVSELLQVKAPGTG